MILTWSFCAWNRSLCPVLIYCQKKSACYVCTKLNIWPSSSNLLQSFALHELHDHVVFFEGIGLFHEPNLVFHADFRQWSPQLLSICNAYSDIIYMLQLFDCWKAKQKRLKSVAIVFAVWMRLQYIIDIIILIVIFLLWQSRFKSCVFNWCAENMLKFFLSTKLWSLTWYICLV